MWFDNDDLTEDEIIGMPLWEVAHRFPVMYTTLLQLRKLHFYNPHDWEVASDNVVRIGRRCGQLSITIDGVECLTAEEYDDQYRKVFGRLPDLNPFDPYREQGYYFDGHRYFNEGDIPF